MSERGPIPAVFDCTVFAQALINPKGPAGGCLKAAQKGQVKLFISDYILMEVRELPTKLPARLGVSAPHVEALIADLAKYAEPVESIPLRFSYPRDPDDAHYVDLAIATGAMLVVTGDRDLLDLMKDDDQAGKALRTLHPMLRILTPPGLLEVLDLQH